MENLVVTNGRFDAHDDETVNISSVAREENDYLNGVKENGHSYFVKENETSRVDFLVEDLDSYLDDINDRLTVSRMVNDSVIRGMVNAVEQEACEKVAQKELEVSRLKETMNLHHVGTIENEISGSYLMVDKVSLSFQDVVVEHDKLKGSLGKLKVAAKNQLDILMADISKLKWSRPMRGTTSMENLGLAGAFQEKESEKWTGVDETLNLLSGTLDTAFKQINDMISLSIGSLSLWQQEHVFQEEVEHMVIENIFKSLKDGFEEKLREVNSRNYCNENSLKNIEAISSLRQELVSISKSLSGHENGNSIYLGFGETGEEQTQKRPDQLCSKASGSISSASHAETNGKQAESVTATCENSDALRHMKVDELIHHFKTEINVMKRDHDYRMQEMTEKYFILKRENLNLMERVSLPPVKSHKETEALKKKIPDAILKLDKILLEHEKTATVGNNDATLGTSKGRLDSVLLENHQLKNLLADKTEDVSRLIAELSQTKKTFQNLIEKLQSDVQDSQIEAYMTQNIYECVLRELTVQIRCISEESEFVGHMMREVYELLFRDVINKCASENINEFEKSYLESSMEKELFIIILKEGLKEAEEKLIDLNMKCLNESRTLVSLKLDVLGKESALRQEVQEKERLQQDIVSLKTLVEAKEKLLQRAEDALAKETEKLGLTFQELCNLKNLTGQQERTILENTDELKVVNCKLVEALEKIRDCDVEMHDLTQKLELAMKATKESNDEKNVLLAVTQKQQQRLSTLEAKEKEERKQLDLLILNVNGLIKEFATLEHSVGEKLRTSDYRLKNLHGQLSSLADQADELKTTRRMYKQLYEKKSTDLQKAEAEVDLLGDEVDSLSDLLEKIYLALDHYSPILKHYPGIIEILKLVKRELSGESRRLV